MKATNQTLYRLLAIFLKRFLYTIYGAFYAYFRAYVDGTQMHDINTSWSVVFQGRFGIPLLFASPFGLRLLQEESFWGRDLFAVLSLQEWNSCYLHTESSKVPLIKINCVIDYFKINDIIIVCTISYITI